MPTGRFAPSPSGPLHVGNLRTALLAWLFARSSESEFLLRIEDLDPQRSRPEHAERQLADLSAIGIDWDGAPARQSERTELYREALATLREQERAYPCWCSRAEIRAASEAPHGQRGDMYPGTCRGLSQSERVLREHDAGRPPTWRLDSRGESIGFEDRLKGPVEGVADDFVLWRWDDTPAYNLAVVVDDAAQAIEEVVRGDDLLAATPPQLLLQRTLGLPRPAYAHVPLVVTPDGERLAKRHGAVTLADREAVGETPADVLSWMATSLDLAEPGERVSAAQLVERFKPSRIPPYPVVFTPEHGKRKLARGV